MPMKHLYLPSLLLTVCLSCHQPNKELFLIFNPVTDSVYHYIIETGLQQMQSNSNDTMWNSTTIRFSLQCVQKDDSLRTMKLVFEGIKVMEPAMLMTVSKNQVMVNRVKGKTDTINTDSHPPAYTALAKNASLNPVRHSLYRALIGDSLYVLMDKQGKVLQVKGFEAVLDRVVRKTQVEKSTAISDLNEFAGPGAINDMLNQVFFFIPNREISTPDNWVANFVLTNRAPLKYSNLVRVEKINGDSVTLYITSTISAKTGEGGRLYEQGNQTGTMIVRRRSGMVWRYAAESATEYKTEQYTIVKKRLLNVRTTKH
jgi:hypothetical protein